MAEAAGVRVVHLRTGIVLSAKGGALKKQLPLFKFGLGGKMGSGDQWQSWISIDDEVAAITHLLTADTSGAVNLTAPKPVTNAEFTDTLGEVLHRPTFLPIPKFGPKLLLGGELAENLLFTGQKVLPRVLEADDGFTFRHPDLATALHALLGQVSTSDEPVVVVGAGLAGLSCAVALHDAGIPVRVFEASDGVGGRVRTDRVDGFTLDRGFQVALTAYPEMHRQLDMRRTRSSGLRTRSTGVAQRSRVGGRGSVPTAHDHVRHRHRSDRIGVRQGPDRVAPAPTAQRPSGPAAAGRRQLHRRRPRRGRVLRHDHRAVLPATRRRHPARSRTHGQPSDVRHHLPDARRRRLRGARRRHAVDPRSARRPAAGGHDSSERPGHVRRRRGP